MALSGNLFAWLGKGQNSVYTRSLNGWVKRASFVDKEGRQVIYYSKKGTNGRKDVIDVSGSFPKVTSYLKKVYKKGSF